MPEVVCGLVCAARVHLAGASELTGRVDPVFILLPPPPETCLHSRPTYLSFLQFLGVLLRPNPKNVGRLRKLMAQSFGSIGGEHFSSEGAGGEELFPYVSFTLNVEG